LSSKFNFDPYLLRITLILPEIKNCIRFIKKISLLTPPHNEKYRPH
jgi:hypothetical protein